MVFTNFEINNKSSNVKSPEFPLKSDINYTNNLALDYIKNTIIFDLARCNKYDEAIGGECYKMIARVRTRTAEENDE